MAEESTAAASEEAPPITTEQLGEQLPEFADYVPEQLRPAWELISAYPLLQALVVAVVFFVLAFIVRSILLRMVARLASASSSNVDDAVIGALRAPLFNGIFLFGLSLAARTADLPFGTQVIVNLLLSVIVFQWIGALLRVAGIVLDALGRNHQRFSAIEARTVPLISFVAHILIVMIGGYVLLLIWGINPVGWLASAGIVGIALGFAAKDTLANLFSGFFILTDAPYKIGDYVNLDSGERGMVTHIGMRSTRLLTRDDIEVTLPNAVIANSKIVNESGGPYKKMRVRIDVGAAYGSDLDEVCRVLQQVADDHTEIAAHPAPRVRMRAFGASSLDFQVMGWIDEPENRGRISHELMMNVYKAFAEANIEIPYAKSDVYIKEMPGG
ncbi:MAG: mechanosensitive ion channel family protein [Pseudomonadota bacterium]